MRLSLLPSFILEKNNQTNNKCLPKFVHTDNASSRIKTANRMSTGKTGTGSSRCKIVGRYLQMGPVVQSPIKLILD